MKNSFTAWFLVAPFFCILASTPLNAYRTCSQRTLPQERLVMGSLEGASNMPCVYFNGEPVDVDTDGSFMLRVSARIGELYLLICKQCTPKTKQNNKNYRENTVDYLQLSAEQEYKCYRFTKILEENVPAETNITSTTQQPPAEQVYAWRIEEVALEHANTENYKIPADTLIVQVSPDFIASVEPTSWPIDNTVMQFARITLRTDMPEDLHHEVLLSQLESINMRNTHRAKEKIVQQHESIIVSMVNR